MLCGKSIVFSFYFKETAFVVAYGAYLRRLLADMEMSAITADPYSVAFA